MKEKTKNNLIEIFKFLFVVFILPAILSFLMVVDFLVIKTLIELTPILEKSISQFEIKMAFMNVQIGFFAIICIFTYKILKWSCNN